MMCAWTNLEYMMQDLSVAQGFVVPATSGMYPAVKPSTFNAEEDAEMQMLYGNAAHKKALQKEKDATSNLAGIQQMSGKTKEFNSGDDDTNNPANSEGCVIALTKVSKLNPNAREFKPSGFTSPSPSTNNNRNINYLSKSNNIMNNINSDVVAQTDDVNRDLSRMENENSYCDNDLKLNVKVKENEFQDIVATLKNQIGEESKSDSIDLNKQKMVAIATLMGFYTKNGTAPLMSPYPEYFGAKIECHSNVTVGAPLDIVSATTSDHKDSCRRSSTTSPLCTTFSTNITSTTCETSRKIKIDPRIKQSIDKVNKWLEDITKIKSPPDEVNGWLEEPTKMYSPPDDVNWWLEEPTYRMSPVDMVNWWLDDPTKRNSPAELVNWWLEVPTKRNSPVELVNRRLEEATNSASPADKINRWLEEPTKRKSSPVLFGPITFKRKESISCISPIRDIAPKGSKPFGASKQYRQTKYAAELTQQYLERSKAMARSSHDQKDVKWQTMRQIHEKELQIKKTFKGTGNNQ